MRKTLACILFVGLAFTVFALPLLGVDLLIDAVGWLVAFNAVRALHKLVPAFGPAHWLALGLVPVCALPLFLTGAVAGALAFARLAAEAVFFLLAGRGFAAWPAAEGARAFPAGRALSVLCFALAPACLAGAVLLLLPAAATLTAVFGAVRLALQSAMLAGLLWFAFSRSGADTP